LLIIDAIVDSYAVKHVNFLDLSFNLLREAIVVRGELF
jgi:hypothetical protein